MRKIGETMKIELETEVVVKNVTITVSLEDARILKYFFGCLSKSLVRKTMTPYNPKEIDPDAIYGVTEQCYVALDEVSEIKDF